MQIFNNQITNYYVGIALWGVQGSQGYNNTIQQASYAYYLADDRVYYFSFPFTYNYWYLYNSSFNYIYANNLTNNIKGVNFAANVDYPWRDYIDLNNFIDGKLIYYNYVNK